MIAQTWSEILVVFSLTIGWLICANALVAASAASARSFESDFIVSFLHYAEVRFWGKGPQINLHPIYRTSRLKKFKRGGSHSRDSVHRLPTAASLPLLPRAARARIIPPNLGSTQRGSAPDGQLGIVEPVGAKAKWDDVVKCS